MEKLRRTQEATNQRPAQSASQWPFQILAHDFVRMDLVVVLVAIPAVLVLQGADLGQALVVQKLHGKLATLPST